MDEKMSLAQLVELSLEITRNKPLNHAERKYFINKFKSIDSSAFKSHSVKNVVSALTNIFIDDLTKVHNEDLSAIDMHEVLNKEIGDEAESTVLEKKVKPNDTVNSLLQHPNTLQRIFNPKATHKSIYVYLDSRYRDRTVSDPTILRWNLSTLNSNILTDTSALSIKPLRNVISAKMTAFRFPRAAYAYTNAHRVSAEVIELNSQAIMLSGKKRAHFLFDIVRTGSSSSYAPFELKDIENNATEYNFFTPVMQLDTISLRFGNPIYNISLDPDQLYATITSVGVQAVITFTQPHYCTALDEIFIIDFNTTNPVADKAIIDSMNNINGWQINIPPTLPPTDTTMTIDVDLSGLSGIITPNTFIYLNSKRINVLMEFTCISNE